MDERTEGETERKKKKLNKKEKHLRYIPDVRKFWQYPWANGELHKNRQ
jgi:hypothetical protein